METLAGNTALVTGASRGIGEAIARRFAQYKTNVAFTYRSSEDRALKLQSELEAMGVKAKAYCSDGADHEAAGQLIKDVLTDFGSIQYVVNNAGITRDNLLMRMGEQDWDDVMHNNLKSCFNIVKHVTRPMLKQRHGSIINISSIVGMIGQAGQANYAASKAGIIGFTKSVAKELGSRNIRCNAIAPGFIETDMTDALPEATRDEYFKQIPLGRFGKGEEVADLTLFLASDLSAYVSGQVISVCGALNC